MHHYKDTTSILAKIFLENIIPPFVKQILPLLTWIPEYFHPNYMEEIAGIAEVIGITKEEGIILNYSYEILSFCTSSIVRLTDGTIVHDRNLDFAVSDVMKNTTFEA